VAKEVRKDALLIRRAAEAPAPGAAREILAAAREIDREFLACVDVFPVRIRVPYDRIEPLRLRRIELGLDTARRMLDAWGRRRRLRAAFAAGELESRLFEMLRLYADETRSLSHSVRLPFVLEPLRERLAQRLHEAMMRAARGLTRAAPPAGQNG
jgi:hypothetical protein